MKKSFWGAFVLAILVALGTVSIALADVVVKNSNDITNINSATANSASSATATGGSVTVTNGAGGSCADCGGGNATVTATGGTGVSNSQAQAAAYQNSSVKSDTKVTVDDDKDDKDKKGSKKSYRKDSQKRVLPATGTDGTVLMGIGALALLVGFAGMRKLSVKA